jgi:hypothetical protein
MEATTALLPELVSWYRKGGGAPGELVDERV